MADEKIKNEESEDLLALATACRLNDYDIVVQSMKFPAVKSNINNSVCANQIPDLPKDLGYTYPLNLASQYSSLSVVQELVKAGADITVTNGYGSTPLNGACYSTIETLAKVKFLFNLDPTAVNVPNKHGNLPIHYAALQGHYDVIGILVAGGANVNSIGWHGRTALHHAANDGNVRCIEELVKYGANVNAKDEDGNTPLSCASYSNMDSLEKVRFLLRLDKSEIDVQNKTQTAPLHYAALKGHRDVIHILIEYGANVNAKGWHDRTAVHYAAYQGHKHCIEELAMHKANLSVKEDDGKTPLHLGAWYGQVNCVVFLIEKHNCDINARDYKGNTPLHDAVACKHLNVVQALLSYSNCDISITNTNNDTPLDIARRNNYHHIESFLTHVMLTKPLRQEVSELRKQQEMTLQALGGMAVTDDQKHSARTLANSIRYHMKQLAEDIDAEDHLDFLYSRRALTPDEYEKIRSIIGGMEKCRKLLITLTAKKDPSWAWIFLESLESEPTSKHAAKVVRSTDSSVLRHEDIH